MSNKRIQARKPGKKRGAKINQSHALRPFGIKTNGFEFPVRAALLTLDTGSTTYDHLAMLWTLADMSERISSEPHILTHAETLKRMCYAVRTAEYRCDAMQYVAIETSANLLVNWLHQQKNVDIASCAVRAIEQIEKELA